MAMATRGTGHHSGSHSPFPHLNAVLLLVAASRGSGADVIGRDRDYPILYRTVDEGYIEIMRILVAAGAVVNATESDSYVLLSAAGDHPVALEVLVAASADVNARGSDGDPILEEAVWRGRVSDVRILVEAGADVDATDSQGRSMLHLARDREHFEIETILLDAGATNESSGTPSEETVPAPAEPLAAPPGS